MLPARYNAIARSIEESAFRQLPCRRYIVASLWWTKPMANERWYVANTGAVTKTAL